MSSNDPSSPSANGANGRAPAGRFARGNAGGPGNPHAARVAKLRATLLRSVTPADLKAVIAKLLEQAKAGDTASIRELLQRVIGPPVELDLLERLEAMERRVQRMQEQRP